MRSEHYEDIIGSYERAMKASVLVSREFFDQTYNAIKEKNEDLFKVTCEKANIPHDLANHMWKIIDAAYETVYKDMTSPVW